MIEAISSRCAGILRKIFPVLLLDEHLFAVHKPQRVDLESPIAKRGPTLVELLLQLAAPNEELEESPIPLILPEKGTSGIALFARSDEVARRFSTLAEGHKLRYTNNLLVKGKPPRAKITVKPATAAQRKKIPASRQPKTPLPHARIEILRSQDEHHLARCATTAAKFTDLRRCFRSVGLTIVGDTPPQALTETRRLRSIRTPVVHLEELHFPHPFTGKSVDIHAPTPRALDEYPRTKLLTEEHLHAALAMRTACLLDAETDSFRLFTGRLEGISGLTVDLLGKTLIIETLQGKFQGDEPLLRKIGNFYTRMLGVKTVYAKHSPKRRDDSSERASGKPTTTLLKGPEVDETPITENGIRYLVQPAAPSAIGLYLDQRDNRHRVRNLAEGRDVLNLFAYTCGFSVAAAVGGAQSTTNVDLAVANLEWGKRNFVANKLPLDDHVFIKSDAFDYFKRAARQGKHFDVIVIDPPSFSRTRKPKRTFEIRSNLVDLLAGALPLLKPGGHMLISTNYRQVSMNWLIEQVERAAEAQPFKVVARPHLPRDFAPDPEHQKSILVRFA